jgi:hypothetical protein
MNVYHVTGVNGDTVGFYATHALAANGLYNDLKTRYGFDVDYTNQDFLKALLNYTVHTVSVVTD